MPPAQRVYAALILAAIKLTRLVANANRPEGICLPSVTNTTPELCSPRHTKHVTFSYTNPATSYHTPTLI